MTYPKPAPIQAVALPALFIVNLILFVMAGTAANKGETCKYPFALRLVK